MVRCWSQCFGSADFNVTQRQRLYAQTVSRLPHSARRLLFTASGRDWYQNLSRLRHTASADGYSLQAFDRHNCMFVHIPKCAGVSVSQALFGNKAGGHRTLEEYLYVYGATRFDAMFKFTIVRNPWDRVISAFYFLQKGGLTQGDRHWADRWLRGVASLDDFVQNRLPYPLVRDYLHFRPQTDYLLDPRTGALGVDFIGRFETLSHDFGVITQRLGVAAELPVLNRVTHGTEGRPVVSDAAIDRIAELYAADIDLLGYDVGTARRV